MTLDADHLRYHRRRWGMDHDRYDFSMLSARRPVAWPGGAGVALWVNVAVQFFPLNQGGKPFAPPGGMSTPYPDLRHFTLREYGNRVGIVRCLEALDAFGIRPTFSVNAALAERNPGLLDRLVRRGDEILASSWHMDTLHHGELDPTEEWEIADERAIVEERTIVERTLETLRERTGQAIEGWVSPARSQSHYTPDLLAAHGVRYMGDWVNDELPYAFRTHSRQLVALPLSLELDDQFLIGANLHSEWEYAAQIIDACDFLAAEAAETGHGRLLALSVHPWLMGQPHRIAAFESVLEHLAGCGSIWSASASEIVAAWRDQAD